MEYFKDLEKAKSNKEANKKLLNKLAKGKPKIVDSYFHELHDSVFKEVDCLKCANCCKTTSPIFRDVDIQRLSNFLRISVAKFQELYLQFDKDMDWVLKSSPCVFLQANNTCSVYEARPKACREYPHTDRKNMQQILDLTKQNALICPAVSRILIGITHKLS
jgi:Fe-S-cluster containining protein